jgi:hypothetical protein
VYTLKGNGTWFYQLLCEYRASFNAIQDAIGQETLKAIQKGHNPLSTPTNLENRRKLAALIDASRVEKTKAFTVTSFIVGDQNNAAVHSEPPTTSDRLFISIAPGTSAQIKEWADRRLTP